MESAEAYRGLVERLEREAKKTPNVYKLKLALLAALGYLVLGGSVLLALLFSAGLVLVLVAINPLLLLKLLKVVWIPVAFGWLVLKALWIRFDAPQGYMLRNGEAPQLVAEVERVRRALAAPRLKGIIIDSDLNAAAANVPRLLGLLGHSHYLVLGLPLMQLLSRPQLVSVIAHEFGHLGGGHGRFGSWIYRVRVSWYRVLAALSEQGGRASKAFSRFFNWYAPYFNAYSFALARENEYAADAAAASVSSASIAGQALIQVHVGSGRLEHDFWPDVRSWTEHSRHPPTRVYRVMATALRSSHVDDEPRLRRVLDVAGDLDDSHPTLSQRLSALGVPFSTPEPVSSTAADELLGGLSDELEARFSGEWKAAVQHTWEERHEYHLQGAARIAALESMASQAPSDVVEHALLKADLCPDIDAVPLLENAVGLSPDNAVARYRLGSLLLDRASEAGTSHIRRAMELDHRFFESGAHRLGQYYHSTGNSVELQVVRRELSSWYAVRARVQKARETLKPSDSFRQHALDDDTARQLHESISRLKIAKSLWLIEKVVSHDDHDIPHYVMLVDWSGVVVSEGARLNRLVDAVELPGTFVVITSRGQRRLARRVRKVAGERFYRRGRSLAT